MRGRGDLPQHSNLKAFIDTAPDTCTSLIVDRYLGGRQRMWAVVAAYGDNLDGPAQRVAAELGLDGLDRERLRELGECMNYNAYGDSVEDLHYHPADLFEILNRYQDPRDFIEGEPVLEVLKSPEQNVVVNLIGMPLADRPPFFMDLLPRLQELRARTGRPHWLIIDEAHHLMPRSWEPAPLAIPQVLDQVLLVTVHPDEVAPAVLAGINIVLAVGQSAQDTLVRYTKALGEQALIENQGGAFNCGRCYKCVRTAVPLRVLGAWEDAKTFPDKATDHWERVIGDDHLVLTEENLQFAKDHGADRTFVALLERVVRRP